MAALILFSTAALALAALAMFALLVALVRRHPPVGLGLICLLLLPLWETPHLPPILTLSTLNIYPSDLATLVFFVVGVLEVKQLRANLQGWLVSWVFFGVCIAVSLLVGVASYGPGTAVNAARDLMYFFFAMTWALAVRPDRLSLRSFSLVLGWALVFVALYHGIRYGLGGATSIVSAGDGVFRTGRVLIAAQAMALLLCAATVFLGPSGSGKFRSQFSAFSSFIFGGVVVIAQHRSVWAAGALGMLAVLIWSRPRRAQVFVLLVLGTWVALVGWSSGFLAGSDLAESALDRNTYSWRTLGWQILISEAVARGPWAVFAGDPFGGSAFLRQMPTGGLISTTSHNWYVDIFVSLGILGLMALFPMLVYAGVKSRALPSIWMFTFAAIAVLGWSYSVDWYFAPWLGAAITLSLRGARITEGSTAKLDPLSKPNATRVDASVRAV